ncbi:glycosyl transferase family 2 [Thermoanaerobacterium xylanolyticum LX-11]|uniref:Glycosyl transferase family 2 n=1 Tax=Thermoanaerobacterium xylanolyticum (strain ATCC 49914 / DSM 7097 / LX-11) TaxID=858215 RepID=F6BIR4_THEXL|nr:TPR domain-containing glycosyltransferase [Thermoanaerobacterium xylanolyticum]AEF16808.1 glycosyl transferase family 2 [Thermoanaerobacterium xylanolyticum LX-11]
MLSLCMIVKNEEDNLERCLKSVYDVVDEIIIVDTGSTDKTVDIAKKFGATVFYYKWNNDFSAARNFSLDKAKGDRILLMDADDALDEDGKKMINVLLEDDKIDAYLFETISYVGEEPGSDALSNLNVRLIKNKAEYRFIGAIHEQILISILNHGGNVAEVPIKVYHYGYLSKIIKEKDKRNRNMSILKKELKRDPDNPFHNFNIGAEYMALGDYERAYNYFKKSFYCSKDVKTGYTTKLIIRMIICLNQLNKVDEAFSLCNESIEKYPNVTDIMFLKGMLYHRINHYQEAINCFKRCIDMGEPPLIYRFITGVGGFKAYLAMGEVFMDIKDFDNAIECFLNSFRLNPSNKAILYKLSNAYFSRYDEKTAIEKIVSHFDVSPEAYTIISDIFFLNGKYHESLKFIDMALNSLKNNITYYIKGRTLMYLHKYGEAVECFEMIDGGEYILDSHINNIICRLLIGKDIKNPMLSLKKHFIEAYKVFFKFDLLLKKDVVLPIGVEDTGTYTNVIFIILDKLFEIQEFELFEKSLNMLNMVNEKDVLLRLGKLYYRHGAYKLAEEELTRSMKLFDIIDEEGMIILSNLCGKKEDKIS